MNKTTTDHPFKESLELFDSIRERFDVRKLLYLLKLRMEGRSADLDLLGVILTQNRIEEVDFELLDFLVEYPDCIAPSRFYSKIIADNVVTTEEQFGTLVKRWIIADDKMKSFEKLERKKAPQEKIVHGDLYKAFVGYITAREDPLEQEKSHKRLEGAVEDGHPYGPFPPSFTLDPILQLMPGDVSPGDAIGEFLRSLYAPYNPDKSIKSHFGRPDKSNQIERYSGQCLAALLTKVDFTSNPVISVVSFLITGKCKFGAGEYLAFLAFMPVEICRVLVRFGWSIGASYAPTIRTQDDLLLLLSIPLIRDDPRRQDHDIFRVSLAQHWSDWLATDGDYSKFLRQLEMRYREGLRFETKDYNAEFRLISDLLFTRWIHIGECDWCNFSEHDQRLYEPLPALIETYGTAPFLRLNDLIADIRVNRFEGQMPCDNITAGEIYSEMTMCLRYMPIEFKDFRSKLDLSLLFASPFDFFGEGLDWPITQLFGDSPESVKKDVDDEFLQEFVQFYPLVTRKALDEQFPEVANAVLSEFLLILYISTFTFLTDMNELVKLIDECLTNRGRDMLNNTINMIARDRSQPAKGTNKMFLYRISQCAYKPTQVEKGNISPLVPFPSREMVIAQMTQSLGADSWSRMQEGSRDHLVDAEMKWHRLCHDFGINISEYGSLALDIFQAIELEITHRFRGLLKNAEFVEELKRSDVNLKGPTSAGTVHFILKKAKKLSCESQALIESLGIDLNSDAELWAEFGSLVTARNKAAHGRNFSGADYANFRARVFKKGFLKKFIQRLTNSA